MAKYVEYTPEVKAEVDGPGVHVWWFPTTFSQSQLGDRIIGMKIGFHRFYFLLINTTIFTFLFYNFCPLILKVPMHAH